MRTHARPRGFSIIEVMIVVLVLSILLGVAVPSFLQTVRNNRQIAETNDFVGAVNLARSEALKRSDVVSICAATNSTTCSGAAVTDWTTGWLVFADVLGNGLLDLPNDTVLQYHPALAAEFTLSATTRGFVRYAPSGVTMDGAETFSLLRPGCTGDYARRLTISVVGRISNETVACP